MCDERDSIQSLHPTPTCTTSLQRIRQHRHRLLLGPSFPTFPPSTSPSPCDGDAGDEEAAETEEESDWIVEDSESGDGIEGEEDEEAEEGHNCPLPFPAHLARPPFASPTASSPRGGAQPSSLRVPTPSSRHLLSRRHRDATARALFHSLNDSAFSSLLPSDLPLLWSNKLSSTAGFCSLIRPALSSSTAPRASISLSVKVLDSPAKLRSTLAHEMCHAAAFLLDGCTRPPHGAEFRRWASRCEEAVKGLAITTCHRYDIFHPWRYQCDTATCGLVVGRHTDSLDVTREACARCGGRFTRLGKFTREGKAKERPLTAFAAFVQTHYATIKAAQQGATTPHKRVMQLLSQQWKDGGGGQSRAMKGSTTRVEEEEGTARAEVADEGEVDGAQRVLNWAL